MSDETSDDPKPVFGAFGWVDLSVDDAEALRDFYCDVVGWTAQAHAMGEYADYVMHDSTGRAVAGVCHARGPNEGLPPMWLMYVTVADMDASLAAVRAGGGEVIQTRDAGGHGRFAVIRDPAGAALALIEPPQA